MQNNSQALAGKQNYNCIDLAKFVCSIMVVIIHVAPFGEADEPSLMSNLNYFFQNYLARVAVPFFFICSGFFLYKKTTLESFSIEPTKKYVLRILVLYGIWTVIYFPLAFRALIKEDKGIVHAILTYLRNCVFSGSYSHLWYLPSLIFAVLIVSFLLFKKVPPKKMFFAAVILYVIGLLAQSWFGIIEPLETLAPSIWAFLKLLRKIIVTTRNGLFEGFIFVFLGMLFAFYDLKISKKKALIGFFTSMLLLFFEVFLLKHIEFVRQYDMYLFLIPAAFFSFAFVSQVNLPNKAIYKKLRSLSSLIFYSHLWVLAVVRKALKLVSEPLSESFLLFIIVLLITIIGSLIVIKLSQLPKMKLLKRLYT